MNILTLPDEWANTLCIISEVTETEGDAYLTGEELARVRGFKREKRRSEWTASRIAAKLLALRQKLCDDPRHCSIVSSYSKPELRITAGSAPRRFVSISHSEGAGSAAIDEVPVGLDIQKTRVLKPGVTRFFLKDEEKLEMERSGMPDAMFHFWCAKEAAFKLKAGRGWLKRVSIHLEEETPSKLRFALSYPVRGTVETFRVNPDYFAAVARQR